MNDNEEQVNLMDVVNLYKEVTAIYKEEEPCEVSNHGTDVENHFGPGAWYVLDICPNCGGKMVTLVCDSFARHLVSVMETHDALCSGCGVRSPLIDGIKRFERKLR